MHDVLVRENKQHNEDACARSKESVARGAEILALKDAC